MMTKAKTLSEIEDMRKSGSILATVLDEVEKYLKPGVTTEELNTVAAKKLKKLGGLPAFLGYYGFPAVICISVNDEVVHGIPGKRIIKNGDIVSLDFGVNYNGMITDAARTVLVGAANKAKMQLIAGTLESLDAGISAVKAGARIGDISSSIQSVLDEYGYGIVRDLVGHGVGHELHEDPNIPNYGKASTGPELESGMTIAIEPMATLGSYKVYTADDGWTILTRDGSLAAHFEDTILVTDDGFEILTRN
jgi:methionyl aminopeptidase